MCIYIGHTKTSFGCDSAATGASNTTARAQWHIIVVTDTNTEELQCNVCVLFLVLVSSLSLSVQMCLCILLKLAGHEYAMMSAVVMLLLSGMMLSMYCERRRST